MQKDILINKSYVISLNLYSLCLCETSKNVNINLFYSPEIFLKFQRSRSSSQLNLLLVKMEECKMGNNEKIKGGNVKYAKQCNGKWKINASLLRTFNFHQMTLTYATLGIWYKMDIAQRQNYCNMLCY